MIIAFLPQPVSVPKLIMKGDGVYAHLPGQGQAHLLRHPPPEAFHPDKKFPDAPAFAHMGSADPHLIAESEGHNGVGKLLPVKPRKGQFGHAEFVHEFEGKEYLHLHPIDGIIHETAKMLEKFGEDPMQAMGLVQAAIDKFNQNHPDERMHLPDVDATAWRKINSAPFSKDYAERTKGAGGNPITYFTNRGHERSPAGMHLESGANPMHKELGQILMEKLGSRGFNINQAPEWVKYPYITPRYLHPSAYRLKGAKQGQGLGPGATIPTAHAKFMPEEGHVMENVYAWELLHHLPDAFFYKKAGTGRTPSSAKEIAKRHILEAFKQIDPNRVPNFLVPLNKNKTQEEVNGTATGDYILVPFAQALQSPKHLEDMASELAVTPAFTYLFGRINAKNSSGRELFQFMMDNLGAPEDSLDYAQMAQYVKHGLNETGLKESAHANAAKLATKLMMAGVDEEGVSNLRNLQIDDPEILRRFRLNPTSGDENLEHRRTALEGIASFLAMGFGHKPQREIPPPEMIPTQPMYSRNIAGYSEVPMGSLPSYARHHEDHEKLSTRMTGSGRATTREEEGTPAIQAPESPALSTQTPRRGQVAVQQPFRPQSPEFAAARQELGQASPAALREVMGRMGVPIPAGTGQTLTPQEQRFQQTFGDPRQQLLSQYLRSLDESLPMTDRLMKAMEEMQKDEARMDADIMKHVPVREVDISDERGIHRIAKGLGLTSLDVRTIAHTSGDWNRISEKLDVPLDVVKMVKVSMGGV
jgi:hypothetical protein